MLAVVYSLTSTSNMRSVESEGRIDPDLALHILPKFY